MSRLNCLSRGACQPLLNALNEAILSLSFSARFSSPSSFFSHRRAIIRFPFGIVSLAAHWILYICICYRDILGCVTCHNARSSY